MPRGYTGSRFRSTSYHALIEHGISDFYESSDVRADYEIAGCPYSSAVSQEFLKIVDMMWRNRESTSSRGHGKRIEFWLISRPEVATPPAFAALPGPNRIFFSRNRSTRHAGHVGRFRDKITTVIDQFLGVFGCDLVLRRTRKSAIAFYAPRPLAGHILEPRNFFAYR